VNPTLLEKIASRQAGICSYGLVPPKQATPAAQLKEIVARQLERRQPLAVDGFIIYDVQDESERSGSA
jgi:hypothetical protein